MIEDVKIYNILISCASDIKKELSVIEKVVKLYNDSIGYMNFIQLRLNYWKSNSYPLYGYDPQEILFDQFIDECDFAIAIFWTRFGYPTLNYKSGVQEEIEKFYLNNKDVLLFFSDRSICPSKIDIKQLNNVRKYKKEIENKRKGLYYTYNKLSDFEDILSKCICDYMRDKYGCR